MKKFFSCVMGVLVVGYVALSFMSCGYTTRSPGSVNVSLKAPKSFVVRDNSEFRKWLQNQTDLEGQELDEYIRALGLKGVVYAYKENFNSGIAILQYDLKKYGAVSNTQITSVEDFYKTFSGDNTRYKLHSQNGTDVISEKEATSRICHYAIKGKYGYGVVIAIPHYSEFSLLGKDAAEKISDSIKFGTHGFVDGIIDGAFCVIKAPAHLISKDIRIFATAHNGFSYIAGVMLGILLLLFMISAVVNA